MDDSPLERVRRLCLALPEVSERPSHGAPTFFIREKKTFVTYVDNHHGDGRLAIWCNAPPGLQGSLVDEDPVRFFVPPYVGVRGWVGARLDRDPDWARIEDLILLAYRVTAPKRLIERLR